MLIVRMQELLLEFILDQMVMWEIILFAKDAQQEEQIIPILVRVIVTEPIVGLVILVELTRDQAIVVAPIVDQVTLTHGQAIAIAVVPIADQVVQGLAVAEAVSLDQAVEAAQAVACQDLVVLLQGQAAYVLAAAEVALAAAAPV